MDPLVFERGDAIYLVGPVAPYEPPEAELEELAFAETLQKMAPNKNLVWMRGQYVEAERANANGHLWSSNELAITSLTPMLMPVTVMHDPRTAVGLIADTKLLTPEADSVPRSRIDTMLGLWGHRFPEVVEEARHNYAEGTLMQSMECRPQFYDCGECGLRFPQLGGAEEENWCSHLKAGRTFGADRAPVRRLGGVTFTGTGLIFGTRGARGAYDEAHLEVFQDEVAAFHEQAHETRPSRRRTRRMDTIEINRDEYDKLKTDAARIPDLESKVAEIPAVEERAEKAEKDLETVEAEKVKAETERDELKAKVDAADEKDRASTLATERLEKLGDGFTAKLGDRTKAKLTEQAGKLDDEAWAERLEELAELTGVKPDEAGEGSGSGEGEFSREETARAGGKSGTSGNGGGSQEPSPQRRQSVVAGLVAQVKA